MIAWTQGSFPEDGAIGGEKVQEMAEVNANPYLCYTLCLLDNFVEFAAAMNSTSIAEMSMSFQHYSFCVTRLTDIDVYLNQNLRDV